MDEYTLQDTIMQNQGELPHRTICVIVADSPEQNWLVSSMMAEANTETTSFVDLRYPPLQAVTSPEPPVSALGKTDGAEVQEAAVDLDQPYPCNAADPAAFMVDLPAGLATDAPNVRQGNTKGGRYDRPPFRFHLSARNRC